MAARSESAALTVDQLLNGLKRLPSASLREFRRRFRAWQDKNGQSEEDPTAPQPATRDRLTPAEERRLKRLIARSERGLLTPAELAEYRTLAQRFEQVSVTRAQALAELAQRRHRAASSSGQGKGGAGGA